jgi:hypothetical protein
VPDRLRRRADALQSAVVPLEPPELRDRCAQLSKLLAAAAAAEPLVGTGRRLDPFGITGLVFAGDNLLR